MANTISVAIELEGKNALTTIKGLEKGFKGLGKTGSESIGKIDNSLAVLKGTLGAQAIIKGIELTARAFSQGAKDALEYSKAIAEINSIVPRTAAETLSLKQSLIGLSNEYGSAAQNQAKAFYNILSAGTTDTAKAMTVLTAANKAAVAGLTDVNTAAEGLLSVVNSYTDGTVDAAQASDILFTTVREGRTTFPELAANIGRVASIAASAKVAFSEVGGALAFVTKSGIRTDEAVVGLRALLTSVIGPTEGVQQAAKNMGIEFNATSLATKGLGGFLADLSKKTGGNVEKLRQLFPNVRAFNIAVKVAGGDLEDFNRILEETSQATGSTDSALKTITDSAGFQFDKLTNQLKNFPTAILTNFEEPISDALKAINEFVGQQGILLIADAVDGAVRAFQLFNTAASNIDQFFNFLAGGAIDLATAWAELVLVANKARQSFNEFSGDDSTLKMLKKEEDAINSRIATLKLAAEANLQANAKIQQAEQATFDKSEEFRQKINAGRKQQVEDSKKLKEEEAENDKAAADKKLQDALAAETNQFNAIRELKLAQKEVDAQVAEEEKLLKQLAADENFQFLVDNLGKETAAKELARIQDITGESKRLTELKKLRDKAREQEKVNILGLAKFEDLSNKEKVAGQKATLNTIASLASSSNSTLFAIGKAASIAQAGINVAQGVTQALATIPPPFSFAAAAAVGAAGAIQIAKIASTPKPDTSAGSFANGGIVGGNSFSGDQQTANVNSGEVIFNKRQQENLFKAVDSGNVGGGGPAVVINNPMFMNQEMVDDTIDLINDRVEFGNKRLLSTEVA